MPKPLRDELGFGPGQELELSTRDGRLEIAQPSTPMRLERHGTRLTAVSDAELPPLTAEQVRETLERVRR